MKEKLKILVMLLVALVMASASSADIIFVDADATGANDGSSWADAFNNLQDALAFALPDDEIRVAEGTYKPTRLPPEKASNPNPANGATYVSPQADLSWVAGSNATSHDVYFGTTSPGMFQGNQSGTTFDPGTMVHSTKYYWHIDEVNKWGKTIGTVWSFTTFSGPPPLPLSPLGADSAEDTTISPHARLATFLLKNGVIIKGGYAGFGELDPNARDIDLYKTILCGDIGTAGDSSDNCYHVVTASVTDETAVLDGFIITCGFANVGQDLQGDGGGMLNNHSSPTVTNCTFSGNWAMSGGGMANLSSHPKLTNCTFTGNWAGNWDGAGMYNYKSSPTLTNCTFSRNSSGGSGGGMYNWQNSSPTLINCTFIENSAEYGGGMYINSGSPTVRNCTFRGNSAFWNGGAMKNYNSNPTIMNCAFYENSAVGSNGGAMNNDNSSPTIINCRFIGNLAYGRGGAVLNNYSSSTTIRNCLFIKNKSNVGGAIFNSYNCQLILSNCTFSGNSSDYKGSALCNYQGNPVVTNCILWGNSPEEIYNYMGALVITYSNVEGGWPGEGNIDADPYFVPPGYWVTPPFANEPNPADGATSVTITADLSWRAGHDVVSHDVYFGISYPPPFIRNQISTIFDPGTMAYNTTYYWRIDEIDNSGTTASDVWSFTTIMAPPPPPPPPLGPLLSISAASSMSDNPQYIWVEGDYHLLPGSPCIDAGDPDYVAVPNETDLDGKQRIISGRIDMGAYEAIPPIQVEVSISPPTIVLESKGKWITAFLWLPEDYDVDDIDSNSILLDYTIKPKEFSVNKSKQVVKATFSREDVRTILEIGDVELRFSVRLMDGTIFEGRDIIRVIYKVGGKHPSNLQASIPNVTSVSINADLSWKAGSYATSHDVYFGTSNPPPFVCNQTDATFDPGTMVHNTTYYWRINEVSKWGISAGDIWSFTTVEAPPPPPPPSPPP